MTTTINPTTTPSQNSASTTNEAYLSNFTFLKELGSAKFSVYLVHNSNDNTQYALKAYPHNNHIYYQRETRFSHLSHSNICRIMAGIPQQLVSCGSEFAKYSFLILEYAPYGDFYQFFRMKQAQLSEKLVRTYFRQLIDGLEYLHRLGIAHLDIKCENLLIAADFKLKITDFDLSQYFNEKKLEGKGTVGYRAPEIIDSTCRDFSKADIYSAGIVLFILKSGGIQPHCEQEKYQDINLYQLLCKDKRKFWKIHESFHQMKGFYSKSFQQLVDMMTEAEPEKRATIAQIKESEWYKGPVLTDNQVKSEMRYFYLV